MNRLYHFPLSPFCRKVRLSLAEKKIEVELVEERYWEPDADFLRRNPAGKVPILKMNGQTYSDSTAICEMLEEVHPENPLLPTDPQERYEVRRLVAWFDGKFGYPDSKNVKGGLKAIKYHLDYMTWILDQRRWLAGDKMTLADFTAAAHLSSLDYVSDVDWNRSEIVKDWYAKIKSRPAFRSILADQVSGNRPSNHYADLDF
jgi:glutathione S-transferase